MATTQAPPFAYGYDGALLVNSDGDELLVCAGPDEGPMWRRTLGAAVTGVGVTGDAVVAADAAGEIVFCDREKGEVKKTISLERLVTALAASPSGVLAALSASSVNVVRASSDDRVEVDAPGATAVALDAEGKRVAVGASDGSVRVADTSSGEERGLAKVAAAVKAICWSPRGYWVVATGSGIARVSADGADARGLINTEDLELGSIAVSEDGSIAAVRVGTTKVGLFDLVDFKFQGVVQYERTVGQVDFGPGSWLGIGLDKGDGNKVDLLTGAVCRTDPHEGRPRNRWALLADPKTDQIQRVMDRVKKDPSLLAHKPAPASAERASSPRQQADRMPVPAVAPPGGGVNTWALLAVVVLAIGVLAKLLF